MALDTFLYLLKLRIDIKTMELLFVFIKVEGKRSEIKEAFDLLKSYGFRLRYLDEGEDDNIRGFFDFSEFGGEVGLLGEREGLFVSFTLMKELESLKKKIKSLVVTLVDNETPVHNPALVTFDGEDAYIEIIVKEGTQYPLNANLTVKATLRNKGKEKMVLKNITNEFLFFLTVRDIADNDLLTIEGDELEKPRTIEIEPGSTYVEELTFSINAESPMCAKLVFATQTFEQNGVTTFYTMAPLFVIFK